MIGAQASSADDALELPHTSRALARQCSRAMLVPASFCCHVDGEVGACTAESTLSRTSAMLMMRGRHRAFAVMSTGRSGVVGRDRRLAHSGQRAIVIGRPTCALAQCGRVRQCRRRGRHGGTVESSPSGRRQYLVARLSSRAQSATHSYRFALRGRSRPRPSVKQQHLRVYVIISTARSWGASVVLRAAVNILEPP